MVFRINQYTIVSRLLEGDFLDYRKAVPKEIKTRVKISVKEFADAIERVSLIINDKFKSPIRLLFSDGRLTMTCKTALGSSYDEIECDIKGEEVEIGFNNRYLLDALRYSGMDEVMLEFCSATTPMKLVPLEGDDFMFLVLPVRIKNEG